ncbi:arginine--tRNA ligase [Thermoleophilia bacterium SCSIO 60948]|nr:arginine--tRNA ligase [Thermoleophilia bacterium SCSIO 60948]
MPEALADPVLALRAAIARAAGEEHGQSLERMSFERPPRAELGDYSTNAAMLIAPGLGSAPREVAETIAERLREQLGDTVERVEIAGPGFVNLFLADRWYRDGVAGVLEAGPDYGRVRPETPQRVLVEFVSANPTGPLTTASGRGAAFGDSISRLLEFSGQTIEREYLLNDAGGQVERFAASIAARMRGEEPPEDGYSGAYVAELADELRAAGASPDDDPDELARLGTEAMRERIAATLERFGIVFDTWFSERELHERGGVEAAVEKLRERGHVYESEGATWLRTTEFGDDKDRVLIRSGGQPTYYAADIAYHLDKIDRGWEHLIVPLGADHHGYVPRMRAGLAALGFAPENYEAPIMQLMNIVEGGERARMSKRRGDFITLDELIDDIGVDAARFFMIQRSHDTPLDLDLDLARRSSQDNPVYYAQYAHARIAGIVRKAAAEGAGEAEPDAARATPAEPAERALVRRLLELPDEVRAAAERRSPHRLCAYVTATAADFHAFYRDCRVVGVEPELERARLDVCDATAQVIATTLDLLGVSAPERM